MRMFLFAILALRPLSASALKKATIEEQAQIITYIEEAREVVIPDAKKNPRYGEALKRKMDFEVRMGLREKDTYKPLRESMIPTENDLKKISGGWQVWKDKRGEYAKTVEAYNEALEKSRESYGRAIEWTLYAYNIRPKDEWKQGHIVNGPPWNRGKWIEWKPVFSDRPEEDEKDDPKKAFKDKPAFIRGEDKAVIIRDAAFLNRDGKPDPGYLASVLYHERVHVTDALTPLDEMDLKNEPRREWELRWLVLSDQDAFELTMRDWVGELKGLAAENDRANLWSDAMWSDAIRVGKDPYNQGDRRLTFNKLELSKERLDEIGREVEKDMEAFGKAADQMDQAGEARALETLKAEAKSQFVRQMHDSDLTELIKGFKKTRELENRKAQKDQEVLVAQAVIEIKRCGFETPWGFEFGEKKGLSGFKIASVGGLFPYDYRFTRAANIDAIKVRLFLARTCIAATSYYGDLDDLECNEGLDIINQNWSSSEFQALTEMEVGSPQKECLSVLRADLKVPMDQRSFKAAAAKISEESRRKREEIWDEAQRQREREERERRRRQSEEERRNRPERLEGEGGGGRSAPICDDLKTCKPPIWGN